MEKVEFIDIQSATVDELKGKLERLCTEYGKTHTPFGYSRFMMMLVPNKRVETSFMEYDQRTRAYGVFSNTSFFQIDPSELLIMPDTLTNSDKYGQTFGLLQPDPNPPNPVPNNERSDWDEFGGIMPNVKPKQEFEKLRTFIKNKTR